jgi:CheY-like chemotaxis protein
MQRPEPDAGLRVLVVDDEPDVLETFRLALEPRGHHVVTATGGLEAVEAALAEPFDIAFVDLAMAAINGPETVQMLRAVTTGLRVVVMTAYYAPDAAPLLRDEMASVARRYGARFCLRKPFSLSKIVETAEYVAHPAATGAPGLVGRA